MASIHKEFSFTLDDKGERQDSQKKVNNDDQISSLTTFQKKNLLVYLRNAKCFIYSTIKPLEWNLYHDLNSLNFLPPKAQLKTIIKLQLSHFSVC